ncbi:MAG: hypothetical protein CVT62_06410 [Actinobacteria bacterium HGW-Actinobacteria-2]|nr:MAG: hypothetical protein CVT62_06410 [Actinobacteria bacterium HGW-Actinobacteria-2]
MRGASLLGRRRSAIAIAAVLSSVAGCAFGGQSTGSADLGPLVSSADATTIIGMDPPHQGRYPSLGTIVLRNQSRTAPVVLHGVGLTDTDHLKVEAAYVLPIGPNDSTFGGGFFVPPDHAGFPDAHQNRAWKGRAQLDGYELAPQAQVNLLVVVDTDDPCGGNSTGVEVRYESGGAAHVVTSPTGIEMHDDQYPACAR